MIGRAIKETKTHTNSGEFRESGRDLDLKLADGSLIGMMSTGQPIVGMAVLTGWDGKPSLAVGTKFGVHLLATDPNGFHTLGSTSLPIAAFAGPGGPHRDRVYVVDPAGCVTILVLKSKDI